MRGGRPPGGGSSRAALLIGLVLTVGLFSPARPWGTGPHPLNHLLLLGPVLLAIGAARSVYRPVGPPAERPAPGMSPRTLLALGLLMLAVGVSPWAYASLVFGKVDQASGMLGTLSFLLVGLPGLALAAIYGIELLRRRRTRPGPASHPDDRPGRETSE